MGLHPQLAGDVGHAPHPAAQEEGGEEARAEVDAAQARLYQLQDLRKCAKIYETYSHGRRNICDEGEPGRQQKGREEVLNLPPSLSTIRMNT